MFVSVCASRLCISAQSWGACTRGSINLPTEGWQLWKNLMSAFCKHESMALSILCGIPFPYVADTFLIFWANQRQICTLPAHTLPFIACCLFYFRENYSSFWHEVQIIRCHSLSPPGKVSPSGGPGGEGGRNKFFLIGTAKPSLRIVFMWEVTGLFFYPLLFVSILCIFPTSCSPCILLAFVPYNFRQLLFFHMWSRQSTSWYNLIQTSLFALS